MMNDVIQIKPDVDNDFACPECKARRPKVNDILIQSMHVMADCYCRECSLQFYQILPVGHNVWDQVSIGKSRSVFYHSPGTEAWLRDAVAMAHVGTRSERVRIKKVVFQHCEDVVILNTLDYLYGHVLLKLYNAIYHIDHQKNLGLILIIPKMFEWLIPEGCAEAWVVDLSLKELAFNHDSIQEFVSQQFSRFRTIYLSRAYSHPDFTGIDVSRLTGVAPFDLAEFNRKKPTVTFVMRQDRWWFRSVLDYWFFRVCRKLKRLSWAGTVLSHRQNVLVKRTIRCLRRKLPDVEIYVVGVGKIGDFKGYAIDQRELVVDRSTETAWCRIYAKSHVVAGVHGSNMLLPTALAAGCVEILPEERYGNMVQDISVRYNDRRQLFFYRFADQYASARSVCTKVVAIIKHYDLYYRNMCANSHAD